MSLVSIIIPTFNEERTMRIVLERVASASLPEDVTREIIVIDDASTDGTNERVAAFTNTHPEIRISYVRHEENKGKGAAIRTGIANATGSIILFQDADLEYDPSEYLVLLEPIVHGAADVVYGSRFVGGRPHRILFFWHTVGNKLLTILSNMATNLNLTDMETGAKAFTAEVIRRIVLRENRFGMEPEITAKLSRISGIRFYEVGISYHGRTYADGKKVNWRDGLAAVWCIIKYGLLRMN